MITIFNRKELFCTYDMKKQSGIRELLAVNHIDYNVKVINRNSPSPMSVGTRAMTGTLGQNISNQYEHIIYVHKNDYEEAVIIIKDILKS